MRKNFVQRTLPYFFVALSIGCDDSAPSLITPSSTVAPRSVEDGLLFVTPGEDGAAKTLTLDVATQNAKVVQSDLPAGDVQTFVRPGSNGREVIVFTSGRVSSTGEDGKRKATVPAHVLVFNRTGEIKTMRRQLTGVFAKLDLSEDGKYALASQSSGLLVSQNAIEVVNFEKVAANHEAADASQLAELTLDGRQTDRLLFSPPGFKRRFAIAPLPNALQIIDLEHPEKRAISITLTNSAAFEPEKIVFAADQFFVHSTSSRQILSFQYVQVPRGEHDFQLAPSILTANGDVSDLAVTGSGDKLRVLALSGKLDVLDPRVGSTASVDAVSGFTQILQFDGASPVDRNVVPRAALYAQGRAQIGFVDLGNESAWATRNVELIELGEPLLSLQMIASKKLALVRHASSRLSVVDLEERTVRPLLLDADTATTLLDESPTLLRLWVATGSGSLGSINLESFVATPVPLSFRFSIAPLVGIPRDGDFPVSANQPANVVLVPRAGTEARRVAVLQSSNTGRVTFLDADKPTPDTALEVLGFFLTGLFD